MNTNVFLISMLVGATVCAADRVKLSKEAEQWRQEHRVIDMHLHVNSTESHLTRAVRIMDQVGLGVGVNLSGGTVTARTNGPSDFERNKAMADRLFPGRFLYYMNLDYGRWNEPDFADSARKQIEQGRRLGAAGLKEFKRLGLYLKDNQGKLIRIDDPKLDGVWRACGELNMPVSIHVADPRAFWLPYDEKNERWTELKDHKSWWFGDPKVYPPREELLAALNRVIEKHPKTTFVCVHFANNAEDLDWVERSLDKYPNMMADLAARIPEIGRHDPAKVRKLFTKHQDRIVFATDFQVYDRLTLGSGGSGPPPTDDDALDFFAKEWRWLETNDRNFPHMTPIQGDWPISGIGLPPAVLRKVYFDNAARLLARSMPLPKVAAKRLEKDFDLKKGPPEKAWKTAAIAPLEYISSSYTAKPSLSTKTQVLWTDNYLYLRFVAPFTKLTDFGPAQAKERFGLWEKDVVEAFIASEPARIEKYTEFEVAPNNERLDVRLDPPAKDFEWDSRFESVVKIDQRKKEWTTVTRIPMSAIAPRAPKAGEQWRVNFYRCDYANNAFLAWSPTLRGSFHTPAKFGILTFEQ